MLQFGKFCDIVKLTTNERGESMKYCPNCGSELIKDKPFCAECGENIADMVTNSEESYEAPQHKQQSSLHPMQESLYKQENTSPKKKNKTN